MNNLYVGSGSDFSGVPTKMLTMNGSLRLSVYNPATIFGIHVSSTPIVLIYNEITIATGQVTNFSLQKGQLLLEGNSLFLIFCFTFVIITKVEKVLSTKEEPKKCGGELDRKQGSSLWSWVNFNRLPKRCSGSIDNKV